jgi:hypothetical protein
MELNEASVILNLLSIVAHGGKAKMLCRLWKSWNFESEPFIRLGACAILSHMIV